MSLYNLFKRLAFQFDPEKVHNLTIYLLRYFPLIAKFFNPENLSNKYSLKVGRNIWPYPIGLAAGFDKNAEAVGFFSGLYFGAVELGTVTPLPQKGNDLPRLFRLITKTSIRNRMGFNNHGMEVFYSNLLSSNKNQKIIGVNIGKNKDTPLDLAATDYQKLYKRLASLADYIVINVSSPNTPGLRQLQGKDFLIQIFESLREERKKYPKDLFLKIAPDLNNEDIKSAIEVAIQYNLTGIVATNTTIMPEIGDGGVSGTLLKEKAKNVRHFILNEIKNTNLELISVGGIDSFEDLIDIWKKGGKVCQIYSSFIYKGPELLSEIKEKIDSLISTYHFKNLEDLILNINKINL